ncbi:uncharacterized protein LOC128987851 [Macrosteles quadrilineatus]|uniref:uncharacterized protein LOC128987851 n=1 Tax=Macrosteles quadrilineatus TaxID=74068 RepID=UPI0023E22B55|nr:uncharacterized protein LOC128987851 [Macrosteles quadrilineatus]
MTLVAGRMPGIHPLERNHYREESGMPGILKTGTTQRPSREMNSYIKQSENQRNEDGKRLVRFCEDDDSEENDRESLMEDETQDVIMFGSNMYFINKSDPNSAVRKLFPNSKLTPINPFINRGSNRENSNGNHYPNKMSESTRNLLNRTKSSDCENRNKINITRRKVAEQPISRRNIPKIAAEHKSKQGKTANSSTPLIERIKQLTCESEETQVNKNVDVKQNRPGQPVWKNTSKSPMNQDYNLGQPQKAKDLPKQAKEGLNLMRYNQCISHTRSNETSSNKYSPTKTSPTDEARRSFLSSLSQNLEEKSEKRNSIASNSTAGDTVYSLSDIEEALTDEEKEIKDAFAHENRQDELELFVQQDAGRTERLRKRYSSTPKLESRVSTGFNNSGAYKTSSSTNLTNYPNEYNTLQKEKPKFGSTIEILQQLQQQIETPYQLEGRRTACSNYSDSSIPISERLFCDESSDGYEPVLPKLNVHRTCSLDSKNYEEIDNFPSAFSVPRTKSHEHPHLSQRESDIYFHPSLNRYPGNHQGRSQMLQNVYVSSPDLHGYHQPVFPDRVSSYNSHPSRPRQLHPVLQRQYCRYPVNEVQPTPADEGKILTPPIRMHTYMNIPVNSPSYPPPPPYSKANPYISPCHHDVYQYQPPHVHPNIYQNVPMPTSPSMMTISRLCTERERGVPEGASSTHDSDEHFPQNDYYYKANMTTIPKPSSVPYHYCVDV